MHRLHVCNSNPYWNSFVRWFQETINVFFREKKTFLGYFFINDMMPRRSSSDNFINSSQIVSVSLFAFNRIHLFSFSFILLFILLMMTLFLQLVCRYWRSFYGVIHTKEDSSAMTNHLSIHSMIQLFEVGCSILPDSFYPSDWWVWFWRILHVDVLAPAEVIYVYNSGNEFF